MDDLQRETASMSKDEKLKVLRGLMQCIGSNGKATSDFNLRLALGVVITVERAQVVKAALWLKGKVA